MPRKPLDLSKAVIYMICCKDPTITDKYLSSTTENIKRKSAHKKECNDPNHKNYNLNAYQFIREHGGWNNWSMVVLEKFPCTDKLELSKKEREYFEQFKPTLNKV